MRTWLRLSFTGFFLVMMVQCQKPQEKPNLIIIMVDTLRADHLGSYGYERNTSPNIDQFADQNILFLRNRSQAACTFPSVNSLLTSNYADVFHGLDMGIPNDMAYLPALLKANGYQTLAISASPIVRKKPSRFNPTGGFGRGFDTFLPNLSWASAETLVQEAVNRLKKMEKPFFLYLHFIDPHGPYNPPKDYQRQFAGNHQGPDFIREGKPNPIEAMLVGKGPNIEVSGQDIQHLVDLYDDEIAYLDGWVGHFLRFLETQPWWSKTAVTLVSDHGEAFMEHQEIKHCRCLYEHQTHTPMMLRLPNQQKKAVLEGVTQNLDLMPTLLDLAAIPYDGLQLKGRSLLPLIQKNEAHPAFAYSSQSTKRSVNSREFKLIVNLKDGHQEFYHLDQDPDELNNLAPQVLPAMMMLGNALTEWLETHQQANDLVKAKQSEELLRSLGYIQ